MNLVRDKWSHFVLVPLSHSLSQEEVLIAD